MSLAEDMGFLRMELRTMCLDCRCEVHGEMPERCPRCGSVSREEASLDLQIVSTGGDVTLTAKPERGDP